jgi:predicted transcriptional regulator
MKQLVNVARGHALLKGRNYVSKEDVPMIVKVVLSTAPIERITIFDILLAHNGVLNVNQITQSLDVSEKTAQRTMLELRILGLVSMEKLSVVCSDGITRLAFQIRLKDEFNRFLTEEFKKLREGFKPDSNSDSTSTKNGNGNGTDDDNSDSSQRTTGHIGRPKADWKNVLEDKTREEKYPCEKDADCNHNYDSLNNVSADSNNNNDNDSDSGNNGNQYDDDKDVPLTGGKISSTAYSLVDCSIKITEDYDVINNGEVVIPDTIYRH